MESLNRYQWHVYAGTCAVVAFATVWQCIPYLPLYLDADLRTRAATIIQATAEREGWITSDLSIRSITKDSVELMYQMHIRGTDPVSCYRVDLHSGLLSSCDS